MMKRIFALLIVSALLMTQFSSCKKDKGDPPVLPPAGSMTIDFSNFDHAGKGMYSVSLTKGTENSTWELAAGAAMLWKVIIYTCLLYTSDAADDLLCVDLGGRSIIKKTTNFM